MARVHRLCMGDSHCFPPLVIIITITITITIIIITIIRH
jgi:hypothetical protein